MPVIALCERTNKPALIVPFFGVNVTTLKNRMNVRIICLIDNREITQNNDIKPVKKLFFLFYVKETDRFLVIGFNHNGIGYPVEDP